MADRAQRAEQASKQDAKRKAATRSQSMIDMLFAREDIPEKLKKRFWTYSDPKELRLAHIENYDNLNNLFAHFKHDKHLYLQEKGGEISSKKLSWLNQLEFHVKINLSASLGDTRDMRLMMEERGQWESKYEQKTPEQEGEQ